jgi:tetratricopeptide (TPR) repeat protein
VATALAMSGCGDSPEPPDVAAAPDSVEAREQAVQAIDRLLEARRIDEAARVAERLAERHPEDAGAALRLGRVRLAQRSVGGDRPRSRDELCSDAADALLDAIAGGIEDRETLVLAATLLEAADRVGEAEPIWRLLTERSLGDPEASLRLALNLESGDRRSEALEIALDVRVRHPDLPFAAATLGELRLAGGDEGGLEDLAAAVELDPGNPAWRIRQAVWLRRLGRCEEAITRLAAMPLDAAPPPTITREIAACWRRLGRPAKAAEAWERVAATRGDGTAWSGEAWREATRCHLDAGDREAASRCLRLAAIADPGHPALAELERLSGLASSSGKRPG